MVKDGREVGAISFIVAAVFEEGVDGVLVWEICENHEAEGRDAVLVFDQEVEELQEAEMALTMV